MKSLLFDLDGTLLVSHTGILSSLKYTIEKLGIEELIGKDLLHFVGPPLKDSFIRYANMSEGEANIAVKVFRDHYAEHGIFDSRLYDGIEGMLCRFDKKAQLYICTSKPTIFAERIAAYFNIDCYIKDIVGSELNSISLSKDKLIEYIIIEHNLKSCDVYMIGDKSQDILAAKLCNVCSVGVSYGYGSTDELSKAKADYIVNSVFELEEYLESIL